MKLSLASFFWLRSRATTASASFPKFEVQCLQGTQLWQEVRIATLQGCPGFQDMGSIGDGRNKFQIHQEAHTAGILVLHACQIGESNRMGKTRDLFKRMGDTKWIFHAKTGTIKDKNNKDLREADEIKKRWQEYTEELYKKLLMTKITTIVWSVT